MAENLYWLAMLLHFVKSGLYGEEGTSGPEKRAQTPTMLPQLATKIMLWEQKELGLAHVTTTEPFLMKDMSRARQH